ncbi:uncharacterized protein MELLADRAFT_110909 [Melampsora larici-populina 98AG31]|uniref:Uncharacterized protein n=1 Tax=Melampsora larici-populina (strain 98AG31 / pathotype 3-4-7) TaxID=747676 RepID=F4S1E7_MELLP|nr:uncharacterized protein MELLADRAFT_110909 [Melampsora larici-populina 98AG31]EGG01550.1 hypothetical protein MELLADRAFT_110909 [Melampsora larici-populina 98AG31]
MAASTDPRMNVTFSGVFRLDGDIPGRVSGDGSQQWFQSPVYLPMNGRWNREVFVLFEQASAPLVPPRPMWLTAEILPRSQVRDTLVRVQAGFAIELEHYIAQLPAPRPVLTVHSRGHVVRFTRQNFDRWIVVALHNASDEGSAAVIHFNVIDEASDALIAQIGAHVFRVGNVVSFQGVVGQYLRRSGKWVVQSPKFAMMHSQGRTLGYGEASPALSMVQHS